MTKLPERYFVDPDTNLAMNTPNQWSQSPYLGAVRNSTKTDEYVVDIHMPNAIWDKLINQNHQKWKEVLPTSALHSNYANIRINGFKDPRQAAWIMQEVLYSDEYDTEELIEDYLEMKYLEGLGDIWNDLINKVPTFEGEPITSDQENEYFGKFDAETRKKIDTQRKNAIEYDKVMRRKIQKQLDDLKLDINIDDFGIEYFVTSYGSVKLKDFSAMSFDGI